MAYGNVAALHGVSLSVDRGAALNLVGPNGAGKTSLLRAVSGLLGMNGGRVTGGRLDVAGPVAHVLEDRRVFADLTVEENLRVGAFRVRDRGVARAQVARALERFPLLAARRDTRAGHLSGGEQRLLAIASALVPAAPVLLLDEPTPGLAPAAVALVGQVVAEAAAGGAAVLVAGQAPLSGSGAVVHLDRGRVASEAPLGR